MVEGMLVFCYGSVVLRLHKARVEITKYAYMTHLGVY